MAMKFLDTNGLLYLWNRIANIFAKQEDLPTAVSDLTNDSGFITASDVPTNLSDFTNDAGFITADDIPDSAGVTSVNGNTGVVTITLAGLGGVASSTIGQASGVCGLDANGMVPAANLPSYVDDVIETYVVSGSTPLTSGWLSLTASGAALTPEAGKIYVVLSAGDYANCQYRWGGSAYVKMGDSGASAITNSEIDDIIDMADPVGDLLDNLNGEEV